MFKKIKIVLAVGLMWFVGHITIISIDGLSDNPLKSDCILILGNKVNPDGSLSDRLQARVDKGFELYNQGYASTIVVSGGFGKEGYYEGTEMKNYLVSKGVSADHIVVDNAGNNTLQTANGLVEITKKHAVKSVIVVSQFFHITRTKQILKTKGFSVTSAHADYFEIRDAYSLVREFFGYYQYIWL